eukprot:7592012-Pyramimonas_sp.AAC.1
MRAYILTTDQSGAGVAHTVLGARQHEHAPARLPEGRLGGAVTGGRQQERPEGLPHGHAVPPRLQRRGPHPRCPPQSLPLSTPRLDTDIKLVLDPL